MMAKSFRELDIWKRGVDLVEEIYRLTRTFPTQEAYGLTLQIRKAAVSVPSNIAEGFARSSPKEYKQFLYVALGSCAELTTQIMIAGRLGYLKNGQAHGLLKEIDEISKMTMSLIKKLKAAD
jgi:four helix bundle protein